MILAKEACNQLNLEKVLWVVTSNPPHKTGISLSPIELRIRFVEAAIKLDTEFELSRVDVERPAPHYAVDTLRCLKEMVPKNRYFYLMGGDSLRDLPTWHKALEFVDICDGIGVMNRALDKFEPGDMEVLVPGLKNKVLLIKTPLIEISSHEIRERVSLGKPYRYYLFPPVFDIIAKEKIYLDQD